MEAVLPLAAIFGVAAAVRRLTGGSANRCLMAAGGGIVSLLYVAALGGQVRAGTVCLLAGGTAAAVGVLAGAIFEEGCRKSVRAFLTPGPVALAVGMVVYWQVCAGAQLRFWDEFSHWGPAAKELIYTHHLPVEGTCLDFQDYPPGTALLQNQRLYRQSLEPREPVIK